MHQSGNSNFKQYLRAKRINLLGVYIKFDRLPRHETTARNKV